MSVYKRGDVWWYKFRFANRVIRETAKTTSKTVAKEAEKKRRRELEEGYNDIGDNRDERIQPISTVAAQYLEAYKLKHRSGDFAEYALPVLQRSSGASFAAGKLWAMNARIAGVSVRMPRGVAMAGTRPLALIFM